MRQKPSEKKRMLDVRYLCLALLISARPTCTELPLCKAGDPPLPGVRRFGSLVP